MQERHILWLFILALAAHLVLLATQVRGATAENQVEQAMLRASAPVGRVMAWFSGTVEGAGESFTRRETLEDQNRALRERLEALEVEIFRLRNVEEERGRLAAALDYTPQTPGTLRPAEVVYLDHSSWLRTLILYAGDRPARVDQPVLTAEGLVGRVITVSGPYAKVQLLSDRAAAASAVVVRTRRQALVRGGGRRLELDFVPLQAPIEVGDRIVTAGTDGIYPRGISIGTVSKVADSGELFREIEVTPAVDLAFLDRVYLLEREPLPAELREAEPGAGR